MKGDMGMSYVVGIAWFKDEATYRRAREVFTDSGNLPASYEDWKALVERQVELIKGAGNIALRADIDPETFVSWCSSRGLEATAQSKRDFVKEVEIEYAKTGKGTVID
jgi:hypothetical protein